MPSHPAAPDATEHPGDHRHMTARIPLPHPLALRPFTPADARASGIARGRLRGTDLASPYYGVRVPTTAELSFIQRCQAFAARMPDDAFFSSLTAARLHGAPLPHQVEASITIHVARPAPASAVAVRGVAGHQVALMGDDMRLLRGVRVSSPVRAWCEVAQHLSLPDLVAVGDYIAHWRLPLATLDELREGTARYPGRRGLGTLRAALPLLNDRSESRRESLFRVFLATHGFTGFEANYPVTLFGKNHRIDIAFPTAMVAFEYQGEYHFTQEQRRKDMTRRARLEAAGWHVMELNVDDLADHNELEARIRAFLAKWS